MILETVWLNLAADPSDFISFPLMSDLSVTTRSSGEVRQLANGRRRIIVTNGGRKDRAISLTVPYCTRDQIDWLEAHVGELMCIRDDRGRKIWGTYLDLPVDETSGLDRGGATIAFVEVTHSEAA